jgi:hypothetical protein
MVYTAPLLEQSFKRERHCKNIITLNFTGMFIISVFASLYVFTFISLMSYWMSVEACLLLLSLCLKETNPMSDISAHVSVDII